METLQETTVLKLDGVRVGCGNVWEREYTRADGSTETGMSAMLFWEEKGQDHRVAVGQGSELTIGGTTWVVLSVTKEEGQHGEVALDRR